jgi:hypothetical protein
MKAAALFFAVFALGATLTVAQDTVGFDTSPYQYQREITGTPVGDRLLSLSFDADLYRHSGPDHRALRLVKEVGGTLTELPRLIVPVDPPAHPTGSQRITHRIDSFEENEDGSIEVTVTLTGLKAPAAKLEIATPLRDFEKSVTVSVSSDGATWTPLVNEALVFDYERFLDFRRTAIDLPATAARRFKVRLAGATDQQRSLVRALSRTVSDAAGVSVSESGTVETWQFRIDELRFFTAPIEAVEKENGPSGELTILEQTVDADDNRTVILLDGGNLPLHELALDTEDRNFRREVLVQVPGSGTENDWHTVGRGFVHSYHVGEFREARLSLVFAERRSDRYRLVVQNGDNPPLRLTRVIGKSRLEEMLFLASADDRLFLFLGEIGDAIAEPRLDTAAILAAKQNRVERSELKPGPLRENQAYRKEVPADPRLLESKGLLWSIIAIVVAMMIWILYLTLKRIDQIEGEAGEE